MHTHAHTHTHTYMPAIGAFKKWHTWPQVRLKRHLPRQLIYFHFLVVLSSISNLPSALCPPSHRL